MKSHIFHAILVCGYFSGIFSLAGSAAAADLQLQLPLARTAYQTNEWIDLAVVRHAAEALPAGDLTLTVAGTDGSRLAFTFAVPAVPAVGGDAAATEHLHVNGWLLRPGHYSLEAACDGASAKTELDLYSHIRQTSFKLINWGRATGAAQLAEGEESLGFNLFYGHYGQDEEANFIRAGMDFMSNCTMSGGHQMDLRSECDWSDPYVTRGGTRRVVRRAFMDRTRPNVQGVHFYDEPGLTWTKNPVTGEFGPHGVPSQVRAFKSAFGADLIQSHEVQPSNAQHVAQWRHWALWKLGFMDAAWKEAQFGVSYVRPDYLSVTQSQYGFSAYTDGYYFNVARSLPVVSGHGGYDDYGAGYFNPSYTLEMARARDFSKPCWYLPTWYGNTPWDRFRLEQYLSFMTNLQGMMCPPDIDPFDPASKPAAEGVVESNKLMARLGTIFTTMPVARPPVAMLYSISQNIHAQTRDMKANYTHSHAHGQRLPLVYLAGKLLQQPFMTVVEEDIVDGTLAASHKAIVLSTIEYLDPKVVTALEEFAAAGGLVLLTGDCTVQIKGAKNLGVVPDLPDAAIVRALYAENKYQDAAPFTTLGQQLAGAAPLAAAIKAELDAAGIKPVFACDQPGIVASRQAAGDIEYLFAVNATYDAEVGGLNGLKAMVATIGLEDDGRTVYDAVLGGPVQELGTSAGALSGEFRFGAGQMRVFARTARPIGGIRAATPLLRRDYLAADAPLSVEIGAVLTDDRGGVLSGSAPLEIFVRDPLGATRYHLFRATDQGSLRVSLPLAANDPAGEWKVTIRELLNHTEDATAFALTAPPQCGAMAGATERAVYFGNDRDNIFRFFRVHREVTIVTGTSGFHQAAAERLADVLGPWDVRCTIVPAADVNRPRTLTEEEAATWVGLGFGKVRPGNANPIVEVGFDVRGPVVLLGTPADNPLIEFAQKQRFLPYQPDAAAMPGRGRGMLAWLRDCIGSGQDSVALIAYDEAGLGEAVGSLYEAAAGLEPLTRYVPPRANSIAAATSADIVPEASVAWQVRLPDRALALRAGPDGLSVLTADGSLVRLDAAGQILAQQSVPQHGLAQAAQELQTPPDAAALDAAKKLAPTNRIVKHVASANGLLAIAHWGGTLEIRAADGSVRSSQLLPQDVTGVMWTGDHLIVGLADGQVIAVRAP